MIYSWGRDGAPLWKITTPYKCFPTAASSLRSPRYKCERLCRLSCRSLFPLISYISLSLFNFLYVFIYLFISWKAVRETSSSSLRVQTVLRGRSGNLFRAHFHQCATWDVTKELLYALLPNLKWFTHDFILLYRAHKQTTNAFIRREKNTDVQLLNI